MFCEVIFLRLTINSIVHGVAYILLIVNLLFMNMNVFLGKPAYIFHNVSLGLISLILCIIVLFMRKGTDQTPLFGIFINVYAIVVVMGTLTFYNG